MRGGEAADSAHAENARRPWRADRGSAADLSRPPPNGTTHPIRPLMGESDLEERTDEGARGSVLKADTYELKAILGHDPIQWTVSLS